MTLVRFNPYRDMTALQDRVNRLFSDVRFQSSGADGRGWSPAVDIFERGEDLVLRAEVPGVTKGDLDVSVDENVLTLRGERVRDEKVAEESYHRIERHYGSFVRTFSLPSHVDTSRVEARYKDGILEVVLPKLEEAKPKQIEVAVS